MGRPRLTDAEKAAKKAAKAATTPDTSQPAVGAAPAGSGKKTVWKFEAPQPLLTIHLRDGRVCRFNGHLYQTDNPGIAQAIIDTAKGVRLLEVFTMDAKGEVSSRGKRASDTPWKVVATSPEWEMETRRKEFGSKAEAEAFVAALGEESAHYTVEFIEG